MSWDRVLRALREGRAQAMVEMAVVAPVLIVLALIVYNIMLFVSATARFDRVVPDIVIAQAVSPAGESTAADVTERIAEQVEGAMGGYDVEVEIACDGEGEAGEGALLSLVGGLRTYRCTMRMRTWPGALSIAGVEMGAPVELSHTRKVVIDPWRPGVVM